MTRTIHVLIFAFILMLSSCAETTSPSEQRIGPNDPTDSARPELVALDSAGNYFAEDITRGSTLGAFGGALLGGNSRGALIGAMVGSSIIGGFSHLDPLLMQERDRAQVLLHLRADLQAENVQLEKTRAAFEALLDARYAQIKAIQIAYSSRRISWEIALAEKSWVITWAKRDLVVARLIASKINVRGQQFDSVIAQMVSASEAGTISLNELVNAMVVSPGNLYLSPDRAAPLIGFLNTGERVRISRFPKGEFIFIDAGDDLKGYALKHLFLVNITLEPPRPWRNLAPPQPKLDEPSPSPIIVTRASDVAALSELRLLVKHNIALRVEFQQKLQNAEHAPISD